MQPEAADQTNVRDVKLRTRWGRRSLKHLQIIGRRDGTTPTTPLRLRSGVGGNSHMSQETLQNTAQPKHHHTLGNITPQIKRTCLT